jgi:hypothetical protein
MHSLFTRTWRQPQYSRMETVSILKLILKLISVGSQGKRREHLAGTEDRVLRRQEYLLATSLQCVLKALPELIARIG